MNLTEPIRRQAQERPDAVAAILPNGRTISYRTLDSRIDIVAAGLAELGVTPAMRVHISTARPFRDLCCRLALARMGACAVPRSLPSDAIAMSLVDTEGTVAPGAKLVPIERLFEVKREADSAALATTWCNDGTAVCALFPTSGTTGTPRFVPVSHDMMAHRVTSRSPSLRLSADVRKICTVGAGTSYGFHQRLDVLWSGGAIVMTLPEQPLHVSIDAHRVTHLMLAPHSLHRLVKALPKDSPPPASLQQIEVGGSALAHSLYRVARERLCGNIVSAYGAAETGPMASADVGSLLDLPGAVGHLHAGVDVQAVDAEDRPLPPGSEGLLRFGGDGCAGAYYGDPEGSASVFRDGWIYTGDVGSVAADGLLTIVGRTSDVINAGGMKVSPQLIEDVLLAIPEIEEAAAFGMPDALGITRIWAAIVATDTLDVDAASASCRERLRNAAPTSFLRMKELPRNDAGKVLRDTLRKRAQAVMARRAIDSS